MRDLIISFIGEDKPGLIQRLTDIVSEHRGSWAESRMAHLGGHFAGTAHVQVPPEHAADLSTALEAVAGLVVTVRDPVEPTSTMPQRYMRLDIVGPDRTGILRDVSNELSRNGVNIVQIETAVRAASMSGLPNFMADARIEVPEDVDVASLSTQLDAIAERLGVDVLLEATDDP